MKFLCLLLGIVLLRPAVSVGHVRGAHLKNAESNDAASVLEPAKSLTAGRGCFELAPGEGLTVHSMKQRHSNTTFLVTRASGEAEPVGQQALWATLETLMGGCKRTLDGPDSAPWFVDVGVGEHEVAALASSLGCATAVFDPNAHDAKTLEMTRCINEPKEPFVIFPALAAAEDGKKVALPPKAPAANSTTPAAIEEVDGVALDSIFAKDGGTSHGGIDDIKWSAPISLLKIMPRTCCGSGATLAALQGAKSLLQTGRVRCLVAEMGFDKNTTGPLLQLLHDLEHEGYRLGHIGPLDSPELEITDSGYPIYETDFRQLRELKDMLKKIRKFDERSGYRAYHDGLSLDKEGHYFEYADIVVACRGSFPEKMNVKEKAKLRFKNGQWWPEDAKKVDVQK